MAQRAIARHKQPSAPHRDNGYLSPPVRDNDCTGHDNINQGHDPAGGAVRRLGARDFDLSRVCESVIAAECALHERLAGLIQRCGAGRLTLL